MQVAESVDHALSSVQAQATSLLLQVLAQFDLDLETVGVDALLVLVQLAFSVWYIIGKAALQDGVDPLGFALVREGLSSVALWGMALKFEGPFTLQRPGDLQKFGVLVGASSSTACPWCTVSFSRQFTISASTVCS